jgi:methylated-DNA-[protein]-cysteine S-methyltransferase
VNTTIHRAAIHSPIGLLYCAADDSAVIEVLYSATGDFEESLNPILRTLKKELTGYFSGTLRNFSVPLKLDGTPHRVKVWQALQTIPYGKTFSYKQLAEMVGSAPIAVGQANGRNKINILVPCHRAIGADGSLVGYGGGLERKRFLLDLEARNL